LAGRFPGARALIISNPFAQTKGVGGNVKAYEEAGVRGLRRGFGSKIAIDADTTTPMSYLVAPDAFDKIAKQHPSCSLLVSLIGLPADLSKVELWQATDGPKLALLLPDLRMVGDAAAVR